MAGEATTPEMQTYTTFAEFYRFYLGGHADRRSRRLHFLGLVLALVCLALLFATGNWLWLPLVFVAGYGFAWAGHLFFEKNRPASFRHPIYSFMGDWRMAFDMLTGRIPF